MSLKQSSWELSLSPYFSLQQWDHNIAPGLILCNCFRLTDLRFCLKQPAYLPTSCCFTRRWSLAPSHCSRCYLTLQVIYTYWCLPKWCKQDFLKLMVGVKFWRSTSISTVQPVHYSMLYVKIKWSLRVLFFFFSKSGTIEHRHNLLFLCRGENATAVRPLIRIINLLNLQ